jgi:hypothetical protein
VPLETDLLGAQKNAMFALGQFAQDVFGTSTIFNGLACVPNTPAALNVIVQPGVVYAQAALDATAYSSLAADSTVTQKQGILKTAQTFNTPAPTTSGQSIVYLISASFLEADTNAVVLPYYNAANPSQAYSGPSNSGASQNTTRQDTVALTLTTGVPATTGNQLTPATPNGQIALYTITVAYGATSVTAANIAKVSSAPFLAAPLLQQVGFRNIRQFTSSGTFNVPPTCTAIKVRVWGGGGGGGGTNGATAAGSGGNAGGYSEGIFNVTPGASLTVTVGAGGTAGPVGSNGGTGGTSSVTGCNAASGGGGGTGINSGPAPANTTTFGVGSGGTINITGAGASGAMAIGSSNVGSFGQGAFSSQPTPLAITISGYPGIFPGGAGSGASQGNFTGGAGAGGLVIIEY